MYKFYNDECFFSVQSIFVVEIILRSSTSALIFWWESESIISTFGQSWKFSVPNCQRRGENEKKIKEKTDIFDKID